MTLCVNEYLKKYTSSYGVFLIGKPAVCARFSTHPWSPVIHKQIQEIASRESEQYVTIGSWLAQLLLLPLCVYDCNRSAGGRAGARVKISFTGKNGSIWRSLRKVKPVSIHRRILLPGCFLDFALC